MGGHNSAVSTVTTTDSTTTTVFKINGYTGTKTLGCLVPVKSDRFPADGHTWRIFFFPNIAHPGVVSFQLRYVCGNHRPPARAIARFTLLPRGGGGDDGEPLSFARTFQPYWGEPMHYMTREKLDKYVADDDSLTVQCDVSVVETSVVKVRSDKRKKLHGQGWIKTALLGFTRWLLPAAPTTHQGARPILA